uniref:Sensory neuron membrane protein 2 n=1 Tax=Clastoptera arizonana TaxID=38151 RepID=A0A1B6C183_9HEMI
MMQNYTHTISLVGGCLIVLLGLVLHFAAIPEYLSSEIIKAKTLEDDSEALERWISLPMPLEFKVYVFNVTNPNEVSIGAQPIVKEMGPYVYDEYVSKVNLKYDADSISYFVRKKFIFNQQKSGCRREEDVVTSLNVPLLGTAMMVERIFRPGLPFLNSAIPYLFPGIKNIFWTASVKDLFFDGILLDCTNQNTIAICSAMDGKTPATLWKLATNDYMFSFFHHKNTSLEGPFVENRGISNISNLGQISSYMGKTELSVWLPNSTCNVVKGTDSSIYPPFLTRDHPIYIFQTDVCASLAAVYEKEVETEGIKVLRFVNAPENFGDPYEYESSKCRCKINKKNNTLNCLKPGVIDLSDCQGAPVISSLPHYLLADSTYKNYVEGLLPNKTEHATFIDIQPDTGVPVEGHKRMQLNMHLKKVPGIDVLKYVSEGLFPILWIDEGVKLSGESLEKLKSFQSSANLLYWFGMVIIILGVLLSSIAFLYILYAKRMFCFENISSNKVMSVTDYRTADQLKAAEVNKTSLFQTSLDPSLNNTLNLKLFPNNHANVYPNDQQVLQLPHNINSRQSS